MIQRIIGILASLAIIVLIVFTVLGRDSYKSMLPEDMFSAGEEVVVPELVKPDSVALEEQAAIVVDSIVTVMEEVVTEP
ncbi:MAG: hypothetical protein IKM03_02080 [Alistipes sp.]|nr:hypothetical protein [Alistipes sp.]